MFPQNILPICVSLWTEGQTRQTMMLARLEMENINPFIALHIIFNFVVLPTSEPSSTIATF